MPNTYLPPAPPYTRNPMFFTHVSDDLRVRPKVRLHLDADDPKPMLVPNIVVLASPKAYLGVRTFNPPAPPPVTKASNRWVRPPPPL